MNLPVMTTPVTTDYPDPTPEAAHPDIAPSETVPSESRDTRRSDLEHNKRSKRLMRLAGQAIADFNMIELGDRVMVCLSDGKDSYAMLDILMTLRKRAPVAFDLVAVNLDQRQPDFPAHVLPDYLTGLNIPFHIETQDTYSIVKRVIPEGRTMCSLCSRLRRGILYRVADELGATKIALGHHRDDILETFFLNLFYSGQLKTMPPKLVSDDGRHVVIRPLAYVDERDLEAWAVERRFPIIPCNLCGSQEHLKRREVKQQLARWRKEHPGRIETMFSALGRVAPSHLLDHSRFDFKSVRATGVPNPDGDTAFDDLPLSEPQSGSGIPGSNSMRISPVMPTARNETL